MSLQLSSLFKLHNTSVLTQTSLQSIGVNSVVTALGAINALSLLLILVLIVVVMVQCAILKRNRNGSECIYMAQCSTSDLERKSMVHVAMEAMYIQLQTIGKHSYSTMIVYSHAMFYYSYRVTSTRECVLQWSCPLHIW